MNLSHVHTPYPPGDGLLLSPMVIPCQLGAPRRYPALSSCEPMGAQPWSTGRAAGSGHSNRRPAQTVEEATGGGAWRTAGGGVGRPGLWQWRRRRLWLGRREAQDSSSSSSSSMAIILAILIFLLAHQLAGRATSSSCTTRESGFSFGLFCVFLKLFWALYNYT